MEVLNNIWIAISTPNEGLVNILMTLATFVEAILLMFLYTSLLNIKSNRKQKLIYFSILIITSLISMYIIPNPFNIFFNYAVLFLIVKFIFKINNLENLLGVVLSALLFALIGVLI